MGAEQSTKITQLSAEHLAVHGLLGLGGLRGLLLHAHLRESTYSLTALTKQIKQTFRLQ
jgi:hypothetical protein